MKLYYKVKTPVLGTVFPQVADTAPGYKINADYSFVHLFYNTEPVVTPKLDFVLNRKAILTDVLSISYISADGFMVNEKVRNILHTFNISDSLFMNTNIMFEKKNISYFWLHIIANLSNYIDYQNSIFYIAAVTGDKIADCKINSEIEANEVLQNLYPLELLNMEKIVFVKNFVIPDIITLPSLLHGILFSEDLVTELEANNVTGLQYELSNVSISSSTT